MKTKHHRTAGGVVIDRAGRVLVLEREVERGGAVVHEVRLPKGHIDAGETEEQAAVREVCEESGYCGVEIIADLGEGRSEFTFRGEAHVREERYFLMRLVDETRRAPAPSHGEEALFTANWLAPETAAAQLTYPSERMFAERAAAWLRENA